MTFTPRPTFPFPASLPSWFVGHMTKALRLMDQRIGQTDLFVEVRDARLPLSSINPAFERFSGKEKRSHRLIVYTKRDLADAKYEQSLKTAFDRYNADTVVFANARKDADARRVLKMILELAHESAARTQKNPETLNIMLAGMPNVGKSSLLNALRRVGVHKGKAATTGSNAGVTKKIQGIVKIWERPDAYVTDTPGIMIPYFGKDDAAAERAMSLALSGGIKDRFFSTETLGEYLLWRINHRFFSPGSNPDDIPEALKRFMPFMPTNDIEEFLEGLARSIGAIEKGGRPDTLRANRWLIEAFREGRLGSWTLDDLTFSGPSYLSLVGPATGIEAPDAATKGALVSFGENAGMSVQQPQAGQTVVGRHQPGQSLIPAAPHQLVVSPQMGFHDRVELSVSTWLDHHRHRLLYPSKGMMSSHQLKRQAKAEAAEQRRVKFQQKGISTRSRFLQKGPQHMKTSTGKSVLAFKRANKIRKKIRMQSKGGRRRR